MATVGDTIQSDASTVAPAQPGPDGPRGIVVLDSPDVEQRGRTVPVEASLTIGRATADLVIADDKVSRLHMTIRRLPGGRQLEVEDHDSRNGTRVDGTPIRGAVLVDEAIVRIGDTILGLGALPAPRLFTAGPLVGRSAAFLRLVEQSERAAVAGIPILLLGETGTGKELVARHIHEASGRQGPFVAINCSAIPGELVESTLFGHKKGAFTGAAADSAGHFRDARGGTLFLDEVSELGPAAQPKLLRVLENGEFCPVGSTAVERSDVRVVAASNIDLEARAASGGFRRDLFARLATSVIRLPPLRARRADIPEITRHFWAQLAPAGRTLAWTPGFLENLLLHGWPLNVRELRIVVQRLLLLEAKDAVFSGSHLHEVLMALGEPASSPAKDSVSDAGRDAGRPSKSQLERELMQASGNVTKIAQRYGKDSKQIYRWLRRYGLSPDWYRKG